MSNDLKGFLAILFTILIVVFSTIGYNLYTNAKNRELYMECLKQAEKYGKVDPILSRRGVSCYAY